VAQDRGKWLALVNTVMNLQVQHIYILHHTIKNSVATLYVCDAKLGTLGGYRTLERVHSTGQNDKIKCSTHDTKERCVASSQVYFIRL